MALEYLSTFLSMLVLDKFNNNILIDSSNIRLLYIFYVAFSMAL